MRSDKNFNDAPTDDQSRDIDPSDYDLDDVSDNDTLNLLMDWGEDGEIAGYRTVGDWEVLYGTDGHASVRHNGQMWGGLSGDVTALEAELNRKSEFDDADAEGDGESEVMTDGGVDEAGNPTLDEIDDLCDSGWQIKWGGRTGRRYPPNNRLVRVINDNGAFREYYVSEDEWDILDSRRHKILEDGVNFLGERA